MKEKRNLHVMKDCVINMPISIGLQKNSPIKQRFDKYIRRIFEAGLIKKWISDIMQRVYNANIKGAPVKTKALMSIQKMIGAITALFVGYILSILVLVGELYFYNFFVKRHPKFNKYSKKINI